MARLALLGGTPIRKLAFPSWPIFGEEERQALLEVFDSGKWGIDGNRVAAFQEQFARLHHTQFGIAVMNGTVSLEIALKAGQVGYGDEVIVPPYTFVATVTAVLAANATPVFADIDPGTYCIAPQAIRQVITPRTRAIIPVHVAGHPADMDAIMQIAGEHDLLVIEDAAHAHLAEWKGQRIGSIGHMGSFSFQASKNMSAGEGGIVITNNEALADRCWSYHNCGRSRNGKWYQHPFLGSNYRMTEFQATILLAQIPRALKQAELRQENATYLTEKLKDIPGIRCMAVDSRVTRHGYHLYVIRYQPEQLNGLSREVFLAALVAEGIPVSRGYVPLYKEGYLEEARAFYLRDSVYAQRSYRDLYLPQTEKACEEGIWLPHQVLLSEKSDLDDIARAFEKVASEHRALLDARLSDAAVDDDRLFNSRNKAQ